MGHITQVLMLLQQEAGDNVLGKTETLATTVLPAMPKPDVLTKVIPDTCQYPHRRPESIRR